MSISDGRGVTLFKILFILAVTVSNASGSGPSRTPPVAASSLADRVPGADVQGLCFDEEGKDKRPSHDFQPDSESYTLPHRAQSLQGLLGGEFHFPTFGIATVECKVLG